MGAAHTVLCRRASDMGVGSYRHGASVCSVGVLRTAVCALIGADNHQPRLGALQFIYAELGCAGDDVDSRDRYRSDSVDRG